MERWLSDSGQWGGSARAVALQPEEPSREAPRAADARIRLLLISDLLLGRVALCHVLSEVPDIQVMGEAGTSTEAVELASRERHDIVVIDVDLRADALDCLERIVATVPASRVIVLSDRTHAADHKMLVERGATGLVLKNEGPEVLIKAIRKVHAGEVWLDRTLTARVLARNAQHRYVRDREAEKIASLTRREHEVIALVGEGLKNAAIAERLFVSEATVRNHLTSILSKLELTDRFELAVYAFRHALVHFPHM